MTILKGDVVFARAGDPVLVKSKDPKSGNVVVDKDFDKVQASTGIGVINGLKEETKDTFRSILAEVENEDAKQEIRSLSNRIQELRKENADPRLIRYLKGELQFRMTRERFQPENYETDQLTLRTY
ncbi:MAG: hypothetical protein IOD12_04280 [Silvanigrellales bacterium]|jgi:hypothetical protein|nr:hypothetical protein [Silvanigrellales bacterium]